MTYNGIITQPFPRNYGNRFSDLWTTADTHNLYSLTIIICTRSPLQTPTAGHFSNTPLSFKTGKRHLGELTTALQIYAYHKVILPVFYRNMLCIKRHIDTALKLFQFILYTVDVVPTIFSYSSFFF